MPAELIGAAGGGIGRAGSALGRTFGAATGAIGTGALGGGLGLPQPPQSQGNVMGAQPTGSKVCPTCKGTGQVPAGGSAIGQLAKQTGFFK